MAFGIVSINEAQTLMQQTVTLVDIRDHASYQQAHIAGAIHLNNDTLPAFIATTDLDTPVIVYCYHGHASQTAAQLLVDQGFDTVYSMSGGYSAWAAATSDRQA
ncbi:MAG: thiosulfate sulfurtransferase GlpE [Cellvibrionaceae bacterium]|nr:thiosulfate sulfurtransferase GlpE [Cellvibrionaceae bacterium]